MLGCRRLSHNSDFVGNVKSVLFGGDNDVSLLESIWSDESVNSGNLDIVEFLAGLLNHGLVGSSVNDEHQCVVVFDGLDGALSGEGVLDDGVLVPGLLLLD